MILQQGSLGRIGNISIAAHKASDRTLITHVTIVVGGEGTGVGLGVSWLETIVKKRQLKMRSILAT